MARRRWRRRILVGGMVLLPAGGTAAAIKLTQNDARRVEKYTGASVEELSEEELVAAMRELGIKSIELDDNDRAIIADQKGQAPMVSPQGMILATARQACCPASRCRRRKGPKPSRPGRRPVANPAPWRTRA